MGNFNSQYFKDMLDEALAYGSNPAEISDSPRPSPSQNSTGPPDLGTPLPAPKPRILEFDPRSPTEGIYRTPIEVLSVHKGDRATSMICSDLPDKHVPSIVNSTDKDNSLQIDPRSPTIDFIRTPIQFLDASDSYDISQEDNDGVCCGENVICGIESTEDIKLEEEPQLQEVNQPTDVGSSSLACQENQSLVHVTIPTISGMEGGPTCTLSLDNLDEGSLKTKLHCLDTPKSRDKVHCIVDKENSVIYKKQIFCTPEKKVDDVFKPKKVRTPLGTMSGNNSPMHILRSKQSSVVNKGLSTRSTHSPQLKKRNIDLQ